MTDLKTKPTSMSPTAFLNKIEPEWKREDSFKLLELFEKITGQKPVMWGASIIGFGMYHYKSERSTQEGDWPLVAFSPRKQNITLYVMGAMEQSKDLLEQLGKHKTGVGCLYIKKLSDIDIHVLSKIVDQSDKYMRNLYKI
jgi:hypothetical protein